MPSCFQYLGAIEFILFKLKPESLIRAVEKVCDLSREDFCGPAKGARAVFEILILLQTSQCGVGVAADGSDAEPGEI